MGYRRNAFPLVEGGVNLGASLHQNGGTFMCVTAGNIQVTFNSDATSTIVCTHGDVYACMGDIKIVEIIDGVFHKA